MAVKLWGPMLTGIAQGFGDYAKGQEDLAYTRQVRAQDLQKGQLANQQQEMANTAQQQALQNADLTHKYWVNALQDDSGAPAQQGQQAAQQAGPARQGQTSAPPGSLGPGESAVGGSVTYGNFKPSGPLSVQQLAGLDSKYNLPAGTAYGLMHAESNGNPNAEGPTRGGQKAQGLFQVQPTTAAAPGYGLKPFDPKDPDGAMSYFAKMYQKAGGDMPKALAYWNAGPGGNPDNPETKAFIPRVQKGAQQFSQAYQLDQAKQQPTPAENIDARVNAGAPTPVPAFQQAVQAQGRQIQTMLSAAQSAERDGHPELAANFYAQAQKLQEQQQTLQEKTFKVQKDANKETAELAVGVNDQSSYNGFQQQIQQNPAMRAAVAGLGLTGDYEQDRNKIATLASRTETLKDQQANAIKQQELQLKQQKEQRDEAKAAQPRIAQQQSVIQDQARRDNLTQKGVPFAPSIAATAPVGTTPAQIQQAQKQVTATNAAYDKANAPAVAGAKNVRDLAAQAFVMVDKGSVSTGGIGMGIREGIGGPLLDAHQQEFVKLTNSLIQSMQTMASANGGARSASTAAMYSNFARAKPNLTLDPAANKAVAHGLYVGAASQAQLNGFLDEYRQSNPDAPVQSGVMAWRQYEQALGPTQVYDPSSKTMVPNMAGIPTYEDGSPNPDYKDFHLFFSQGHF
jgi:soluble lytic murein transglycosylase-like protein